MYCADAFELEADDEPIIILSSNKRHKHRVIQDNIIDTKAQQSRPRGPRNKVFNVKINLNNYNIIKRPPNPANRRQKAEQGQSPIEDNPPPPADDKVNIYRSL